MTRSPGSVVRVVMSKWGERPHWEFEATYLGRDAHGDWCGVAAGTRFLRPGVEWFAPVAQVMCVPAADAAERWWLATFHDTGGPVEVYVDMTTPPSWDGSVLRAVDLDLDVVRGPTGRVWVDDEDEFAEHRVTLGYPDDVVRGAVSSSERISAAVTARTEPFDGPTHRGWLDRFDAAADRRDADRTGGSRGGPPPA